MSEFLSFLVVGEPAPKGSWRVVQRGKFARLVNDNKRTAPWSQLVTDAAHVATGAIGAGVPMFKNTPLAVGLRFVMPRPKSNKDDFPSVKPDIDKLCRSTLDAMEGVVFDNDSRIVDLHAVKVYVTAGIGPGVTIRVVAL